MQIQDNKSCSCKYRLPLAQPISMSFNHQWFCECQCSGENLLKAYCYYQNSFDPKDLFKVAVGPRYLRNSIQGCIRRRVPRQLLVYRLTLQWFLCSFEFSFITVFKCSSYFMVSYVFNNLFIFCIAQFDLCASICVFPFLSSLLIMPLYCLYVYAFSVLLWVAVYLNWKYRGPWRLCSTFFHLKGFPQNLGTGWELWQSQVSLNVLI